MTAVRLALVGFGRWGRRYIQAAADSGEARVTQVILRNESSQIEAARSAGLKVAFNIEEVDADAAVIAAHPRQAPWLARLMMEACDLPVMIEKPAALSLGDAEAIKEAERDTRKLVLINHQHLFADAFSELRAIADDVLEWTAIWCGPGPVRDYSALWDYGPHAVAAAYGVGVHRSTDVPHELHPIKSPEEGAFFFALRDHDGRACKIGVSNSSEHKGALIKGVTRQGVRVMYDGYAPAEPPLTKSVRAFARAVKAGGTDDWRFGAGWATRVSLVLEAIDDDCGNLSHSEANA